MHTKYRQNSYAIHYATRDVAHRSSRRSTTVGSTPKCLPFAPTRREPYNGKTLAAEWQGPMSLSPTVELKRLVSYIMHLSLNHKLTA